MQVFKRLNSYNQKPAQNLIEFMFVLPIMLFLTLAIFEVALFWQDVNAIYSLNADINANIALIDFHNQVGLGSTCTAATKALEILDKKDSVISLTNPTYNPNPTIDGEEPFALYEYKSNTKLSDGTAQITLWVDCRNPFENGIITQLQFYHKTLVMKASIPRFDEPEPIVIIPEDIYIASPKLNTLRSY